MTDRELPTQKITRKRRREGKKLKNQFWLTCELRVFTQISENLRLQFAISLSHREEIPKI